MVGRLHMLAIYDIYFLYKSEKKRHLVKTKSESSQKKLKIDSNATVGKKTDISCSFS